MVVYPDARWDIRHNVTAFLHDSQIFFTMILLTFPMWKVVFVCQCVSHFAVESSCTIR